MNMKNATPTKAQSLNDLLGRLGFDSSKATPRNERKRVTNNPYDEGHVYEHANLREKIFGEVLSDEVVVARAGVDKMREAIAPKDALLADLVPSEEELLEIHHENYAAAFRQDELPGLEKDEQKTVSTVIMATLQHRFGKLTDTRVPLATEDRVLGEDVAYLHSQSWDIVGEHIDAMYAEIETE